MRRFWESKPMSDDSVGQKEEAQDSESRIDKGDTPEPLDPESATAQGAGENEQTQVDESSGDETVEESSSESTDEARATYDKYLRAVAELENYKKRSIKERSELLKYAGEALARDLLEVVDQLQLAMKHADGSTKEDLANGVQMVLERFLAVLERHQIKGAAAVGEPFDPHKHEALATTPAPDHKPGTVVEEFKRAYFYKDKLLRPAQVVVAEGRSGGDNEE